MPEKPATVDFLETGSGKLVVLVHSAVSGARQWRRMMTALDDRYHLVAVNLFGYGDTPKWHGKRSQTLEDHARLIETVLPDDDGKIALVGHSLGGAIVMKAASRLGARVDKLVLIEPNPFYLLDMYGRDDAFAETMELCNQVKQCGASDDWATGAEYFADYWVGPGHWESMPEDRQSSFIEGLRQNFHEWDAVMDERTSLDSWRETLPERTLVVSARGTARPIVEIVELMREHCSGWEYRELAQGGHMAPLTHPELVTPIVAEFLDRG